MNWYLIADIAYNLLVLVILTIILLYTAHVRAGLLHLVDTLNRLADKLIELNKKEDGL